MDIPAIYRLHDPLTDREIDRLACIGRDSEAALRRVADAIRPGMTEREIRASIIREYVDSGMDLEVVLVGSDERIPLYRHPYPSDRKVEKLVLLHPSAKRWGLHAAVTRMVWFGDKLPEELARRYDLANRLEAQAISMCVPGTRFHAILDERKKLLDEHGYSDEWEKHFPGGITGYQLVDATVCADPKREVVLNQAYDWFITITGVKVEELSVNINAGRKVLSVCGNWPCADYTANGQTFKLPLIYMK